MSQKGPAPRPTSRRPSRSPPAAILSSPIGHPQAGSAQQDDPRTQSQHARSNPQAGEERGRPQPVNPRTSMVHNMLNPTDQRHSYGPAVPLMPAPVGGEGSQPSPTVAQRPPHSYALHGQQHQSTASAQPAYSPVASFPLSRGPSPRGSPMASHTYSPLLAGRRMLPPKSPRIGTLGRASAGAAEFATRSFGSRAGPQPVLAAYDLPPHGGHLQFRDPGEAAGLSQELPELPPKTAAPTSRPNNPQPAFSPPRRQQDEQQPASRPSIPTPGPGFAPPARPGSAMPTLRHAGDSQWPTGVFGQIVPRMPVTRGPSLEGQHLLAITPQHGEEIVVPVDMHQGSKHADEKRHRNAGASARFRQRKKEREKEQQVEMQKLEATNRELERRVRELEAERDYYREERSRLRAIVARTPSIGEWADRGPPSPASKRSGRFMVEGSIPVSSEPPLGRSLPSSHPTGDPSTFERPARRRRTDSETQFQTHTYVQPQPPQLPSFPGPAYGMSPSTHAPAPTDSARLPPLRIDPPPASEALAGSGPSTPIPILPQAQQQPYAVFGRLAHEAGWPPRPGGPPPRHDGSQG